MAEISLAVIINFEEARKRRVDVLQKKAIQKQEALSVAPELVYEIRDFFSMLSVESMQYLAKIPERD